MIRCRRGNESFSYILGIVHKYYNFEFYKKIIDIKTLESLPKYD